MPRVKKTRKVTEPIPPKSSQPIKEKSKKPKKTSGKAPGNRNSLKDNKAASGHVNGSNTHKDARLGSKKKVPLLVSGRTKSEPSKQVPKFKSPVDELNYIENDPKLQSLLDKIDNELSIAKDEQAYVTKLLDRHKVLCELLGIKQDDENDIATGEKSEFDLLDVLEKPLNKSL